MGKVTDADKDYVKNSILYFYEQKTQFDAHKNNFDNIKSEFESDMEMLYDKYANDDGVLNVRTDDKLVGIKGLRVKKVQPMDVELNYEKFRHACKDKEVRRKAIKSSYNVTDMPGLLNFLKEQGITYKDVKQFLHRNVKVDVEAVENLVETGELDEEVVKESTYVRLKKPYYRITPIKPSKSKQRAVVVDA